MVLVPETHGISVAIVNLEREPISVPSTLYAPTMRKMKAAALVGILT